MLAGLANDKNTSASIATDAATTLVEVLIGEGKLDEASERLDQRRAALSADTYDALKRRIAAAWIRQGNLDRAEAAIAADSSVEGLALSGQIRLYQGDIPGAVERFKAAGPYAGDLVEATHRTALLAVLQGIEAESLPALGKALLLLEQADTAQAAEALEHVAAALSPPNGGAELYLLAGRLAAATAKPADAERLFRAAAVKEVPATAPAAELALAQLFISSSRQREAVEVLEHLILTYPESALVPQARRKLDEARGAVPKT
jgi:outer membrane PBP1 activator LpoA protein